MVNAHSRFVWYELMTTNMERAVTFYSSVVGWQTRDQSQPGAPYVLFTVGGVSVSGLMDLSAEAWRMGARPSWIGYIGTDNIGASADWIERLGGTVLVPPTEIPNVSRFSVVADPQGRRSGSCNGCCPRKLRRAGFPPWAVCAGTNCSHRTGWRLSGSPASFSGGRRPTPRRATPVYQLLSIGGETLGAIFGPRGFVGSAFWLFYFVVADIDQAVERVAEGGGKVLEGPTEVPGESWAAHCTDPQGVMFALVGKRKARYRPRRPYHRGHLVQSMGRAVTEGEAAD